MQIEEESPDTVTIKVVPPGVASWSPASGTVAPIGIIAGTPRTDVATGTNAAASGGRMSISARFSGHTLTGVVTIPARGEAKASAIAWDRGGGSSSGSSIVWTRIGEGAANSAPFSAGSEGVVVSPLIRQGLHQALNLAKSTAAAITESEEDSASATLVTIAILLTVLCVCLVVVWCALCSLRRRIFGRWTRLDKQSSSRNGGGLGEVDEDEDEESSERERDGSKPTRQRQQSRSAVSRSGAARSEDGACTSLMAEGAVSGGRSSRGSHDGSHDELLSIAIAKPASGGMGMKVNGSNSVTAVSEGGVADRAGLRVGDVVVRVDGEELTRGTGLATALHGRNEGRRHTLRVSRAASHAKSRAEHDTIEVNGKSGGSSGNGDGGAESGGDGLDKYLAGPAPVPNAFADLIMMKPASAGAPAAGAPNEPVVMMV